MYNFFDTVAAVSSPGSEGRVIIRLTGPEAVVEVRRFFEPSFQVERSGIVKGYVTVGDGLKVEAQLYLFLSPFSYTGEDVVEIHMQCNLSVAESFLYGLLEGDVRMAGPGEFTARGYLNGKMDLSQAEAVNEIIVSSNRIQLAAAERLVEGRLAEAVERIGGQFLDCISLLEAGLDFSGEDIEFIGRDDAVGRLSKIRTELEELLSGSVSYEAMIDLPSVGVAGAPNTGKSLLVNSLLGERRSIVSGHRRTTRDILTSQLSLEHSRCVLFDCAGLVRKAEDIIDRLSHQAAIEALGRSNAVVFCVDLSKGEDGLAEDIAISRLISPEKLIAVGTKADLVDSALVNECLERLGVLFGYDFIATSAKRGFGIEQLKQVIDKKLIESSVPAGGAESKSGIGLTARHRCSVTEAIEDIGQAIEALDLGSEEVAVMLIRAAYSCVSDIERQDIDEKVLENIFSRFCIGK